MEREELVALLERLRAENEYLRAQLRPMAAPLYMSGRWPRRAGDNIQPQIPRYNHG